MIGKINARSDASEADMWVIYRHPTDYPDKYVARRWVDEIASIVDFVVADTLSELQAALVAAGRSCLGRSTGDDPVIVEVWL